MFLQRKIKQKRGIWIVLTKVLSILSNIVKGRPIEMNKHLKESEMCITTRTVLGMSEK